MGLPPVEVRAGTNLLELHSRNSSNSLPICFLMGSSCVLVLNGLCAIKLHLCMVLKVTMVLCVCVT